MAILLDTSFLIAFDNERDVHNKKARDLWVRIKQKFFGEYFISDYIFDEVVSVTMRKHSKERAEIFGQHIKDSLNIININSYLFEESWKFFKETKLALSFTDCTNIILLKSIGLKKIATFDNSFKEVLELEVINE